MPVQAIVFQARLGLSRLGLSQARLGEGQAR